jgi:hypothetical protein
MLYLIFACCVIVFLIAMGIKTAADAKVEEIERSVNRQADKLARKMMRERLEGLQIQVTQKIVVIEDDLKMEVNSEKENSFQNSTWECVENVHGDHQHA